MTGNGINESARTMSEILKMDSTRRMLLYSEEERKERRERKERGMNDSA